MHTIHTRMLKSRVHQMKSWLAQGHLSIWMQVQRLAHAGLQAVGWHKLIVHSLQGRGRLSCCMQKSHAI